MMEDSWNHASDGSSFTYSTTVSLNADGTWAVGGDGTATTTTTEPFLTPTQWGIPASFTSCPAGHVVGAETVEYLDGVIVSNCVNCGTRIELVRLPGGMSKLRIQTFLGALMMMDVGLADLSEILGDLVDLEDALREEEEQLNQARSLLETARLKINQRLADECH